MDLIIIIVTFILGITFSRLNYSLNYLLLLLLFCLVLYFVYAYFLSFARAHFVIGPWAVELASK
jgi:hypothetical protein